MNSEGDFFIGNKKSSSATGQERTFDVPSPTVTGQEAGRLSVVFDEVLIKERLRVEGGKSGTVLSSLMVLLPLTEKLDLEIQQQSLEILS